MEFTETHLDSVNSADNEEVFLQSTVTDAQCAASTDVFEDQLQESASKYPMLIKIIQHGIYFLSPDTSLGGH